MSAIVVCSMLHESTGANSATRRFRGEPVLAWTMRRLAMTTRIDRVVLLAWDDQLEALSDLDVNARACGPRRQSLQMQSIAAAQRWADGWRGGLLQSCWFDNGFAAELVRDAMIDEQADQVVLVDPAAGLVDPAIVDQLVEAAEIGTKDFFFTLAVPGLGGVLLKRAMVDRLANDRIAPGKLVHYLPDAPIVDPITSEACVDVPLEVSRVADRFTLDSHRQISRLEQALQPLNGTLISSRALAVVRRASAMPAASFPRDITLELTTRRHTKPIFSATGHADIRRPDISDAAVSTLIDNLAGQDAVRITLAGVGDPLLHPNATEIIRRLSAVAAVSIETDLLDVANYAALANSGADVVAVHLPAMTPVVYREVMGVDRMPDVVQGIQRLLEARQTLRIGTPVVAPLFTKLLTNFEEMERWYDTWLRALGSAVIVGPSTFGGLIADAGVADMAPPVRRPCARLRDRITILSDGSIVTCEQDVLGRQSQGRLGEQHLADVWRGPFAEVRQRHIQLTQLPDLCNRCSEWHRP